MYYSAMQDVGFPLAQTFVFSIDASYVPCLLHRVVITTCPAMGRGEENVRCICILLCVSLCMCVPMVYIYSLIDIPPLFLSNHLSIPKTETIVLVMNIRSFRQIQSSSSGHLFNRFPRMFYHVGQVDWSSRGYFHSSSQSFHSLFSKEYCTHPSSLYLLIHIKRLATQPGIR